MVGAAKEDIMNSIIYNGQELALSENVLYMDGTLDAQTVLEYPYVYNDIGALAEAINSLGKKSSNTVTVYIAPHVYWIDDPDATDTVQCGEGDILPFGLKIACDRLRLVGLCEDAGQVILAGNRGQSHGANGNYTMFCFRVRDLELQNLTIGNYCSVDLEYPLKPELSRARRTNAFTQAQLAWQQGDKLWARNCRFVSRLNLMPVCGGERCLYENCHFESTDDALNGRGVYLGCDFDFYGNRPFYSTRDSGAVFLDCIFKSRIKSEGMEKIQYFTKEGGPVTVVDCEYQRPCRESVGTESMEVKQFVDGRICAPDAEICFGWTKYPKPSLRCYQSNVRYQGEPVIIGGKAAAETVVMDGNEVLEAYRLEAAGKVIYNTYNLLRGEDDWDPMQVKDMVIKAGREAVPTLLTIQASAEELISGESFVSLTALASYFHGKQVQQEQIQETSITFWVSEADKAYVQLADKGGGICLVEGVNKEKEAKDIIVYASTAQGLEAAAGIRVFPEFLEAPVFLTEPQVELSEGAARVCYEADFGEFEDCSAVSWYRCKEADGRDAVLVAVSRENVPMKEYLLTAEDVGYYLKAEVVLCHSRSRLGACSYGISAAQIKKDDIAVGTKAEIADCSSLVTDFRNMPTQVQERILPGFWTMDQYRPLDTVHFGKWESAQEPGQRGQQSAEPWKYGETGNGSVGKGLYQNVQGARLMYTPLPGKYGDMSLRVKLDPAKTAGQGFGSADQYMDFCIKFDTATLTGYGVRILRSAEASDAVKFLFVEYSRGETRMLNEGILTSCFLTGCEIVLKVVGSHMSVHAESETANACAGSKPYAVKVDMDVEIRSNPFGGVAVQHTGTPGTGGFQNTTMLHTMELQFRELEFHEL